MKKQTKIILGVLVLAAAAAVLLGLYFGFRPEAQTGAKALSITVVHGDGSEKVFKVRTDAEYLDQVLLDEKLVEDNQTEWGLYILTADGETADEGKEQWWCITRGGEMVNSGAGETPVADGDAFELTLTVGFDG